MVYTLQERTEIIFMEMKTIVLIELLELSIGGIQRKT